MTRHVPDSDEEIVVEQDGPIATIWLNRPAKRNAMTIDMWAGVAEAARSLTHDHAVRVLVVRGAGDAFCAGADISGLRDKDGMSYADVNASAEAALAFSPKPTIAFIDGPCVGGGVQLAMACDIRVGTTDATLGITPARLGILFPPDSLERVVRQIGASAAKLLIFSAELISAEHAQRIGLLDEIHPPAQARERLAGLCSVLSSRSLLTQEASKEMIDAAHRHGSVDPDLTDWWMSELSLSEDHAEGVAAFLERRSPAFTWTQPRTARRGREHTTTNSRRAGTNSSR
jgi:enoyl-CoA hydratase/carnithine racemase